MLSELFLLFPRAIRYMVELQPKIGDLLLTEENPNSQQKNLTPEELVGAWTKEYEEETGETIDEEMEPNPIVGAYEEVERAFKEYGENLLESYLPTYHMTKMQKEKFMGFVIGSFHGAYSEIKDQLDYDFIVVRDEEVDGLAYGVIRRLIKEIEERIH